MPTRAACFMLFQGVLLTTGCSVWPGPDHRSVTLDRIQSLIEDSELRHSQQHCQGFDDLRAQMAEQRQTLVRVEQGIAGINSSNPAFMTAECPPQEAPAAIYEGKTIIGSSEWIYLSPPGHHYQARIDSGAATSSLSAMNIERFERNGERWVRFDLQHDDEAKALTIEAPLVRHVRIRQASSEEAERRPVVALTVNLGSHLQQETEFSLTDRSQMTYPILLGREFLRDVTLIDVGQQFIHPKFVPDIPATEERPQMQNNEGPQS